MANTSQLQLKSTILGIRLSKDISQQSRDIARETKRESSAMTAIAVLTMFFLLATFFAVSFFEPVHVFTALSIFLGFLCHAALRLELVYLLSDL
jgi:hypothetical protein